MSSEQELKLYNTSTTVQSNGLGMMDIIGHHLGKQSPLFDPVFYVEVDDYVYGIVIWCNGDEVYTSGGECVISAGIMIRGPTKHCSGGHMKYEGLHLDFFEVGGAVSVRRNYLHGKIQGTAYGYYENGEISEETEYVNGKRHGFYREYYEKRKDLH